MTKKNLLCCTILLLSLAACFQQPQGPAERLGKSIDQLTKDLKYADEQWGADAKPQEAKPPRPYDAEDSDYGREDYDGQTDEDPIDDSVTEDEDSLSQSPDSSF